MGTIYQRRQGDDRYSIYDRTAVFIDYENIRLSFLEEFNVPPDIFKIVDHLRDIHGELTYCKIYMVVKADQPLTGLVFGMNKAGITTHVKVTDADSDDNRFAHMSKRNLDVALATDAAMAHGRYDTICIISGDSDYIHLVDSLKSAGHRVEVGGVYGHISKGLIETADLTVLFDKSCALERYENSESEEAPAPDSTVAAA